MVKAICPVLPGRMGKRTDQVPRPVLTHQCYIQNVPHKNCDYPICYKLAFACQHYLDIATRKRATATGVGVGSSIRCWMASRYPASIRASMLALEKSPGRA